MALQVNAAQLETLAGLPEVASIYLDEKMQLSLFDTVPQLGADAAWLEGYTGNGQVIAILDAGFDTAHSAFTGRIVDEACYSTTSFIDNTVSLCPDGDKPNGEDSQVGPGAAINCTGMLGCDHGTHVAGIAASGDDTMRGIAPEAGILPIQVFSQLNDLLACGFEPSCLVAYSSDIIRGLERVYALRDTYAFAAVNMSLGGEAYTNAAACDNAYPAIKAAVDNLRAAGITTVVASGNEYHTDALATPACLSSTVSVGAVDVIDTVAYFSNSADFLDVLSGGVGIVSAVPGDSFQAKSGTSMASPGVAGAVAVLRSADPGATPEEIVDAIKTTGVPIVDWRNDIVTPRVQVDAAARLLVDGQLGFITLALVPEIAGLDAPVGVTHAGDGSGRLFVMQRGGTVLVRDQNGVLATPFLDVSGEVAPAPGDGLLGLAFHPGYASNGRVYVSYLSGLGDIVVERYTVSADPNRVDAGSVSEVLRIASTLNGHHGGRLHFGPDGYLYVATGDGAEDGTVPLPGPSGDPASPLGKILRIDVDAPGVPYAVPLDNPLVGVAGALEEIWAAGLRDPRRFAFDALSGELYVADVGESAAHEVNVQAADSTGGEDYGWNAMEGSACRAGLVCDPTGFVLPVAEYGFDEGCAVTGGVVYRGAAHPDLYGAYLFGDLCSGRIWGLRQEDGEWRHVQMTQAPVQVSAFGSDESGAAYLVDQAAGQIYRLELSDLAIDTLRLPVAYTDVAFNETLVATGGAAPYQWSIVDGALPAGYSLDPVSGTISGTTDTTVTAAFKVQVEDAEFATVTRNLRLVVTLPPLLVETQTLAATTIDRPYSETLVARGGTPPYAWALSGGALPTGILLGTDGTLSGTAAEQGIFSFTAQVTDSAGEQTTQDLSLLVFGATVALSVNVPEPGPFGNGYGSDQHLLGLYATFTGGVEELAFHATGYDIDYADELAVYVNGTLLGYFTVGPNNAVSSRDVFVIPLAAQVAGENVLLIRNRTSGFIWGVFDLLLSDQPAPLVITTEALSDATAAMPYSASLEAVGGRGAYTWSLIGGALPTGLSLANDGSITGTPTEQGVFGFTARVTDGLGTSTDQAFTLRSVGATGTVEVALQIDVPDAGSYGNNFGSNQHPTELYATFTGTNQDLTLHVTGYDIDYADELAVSLNGTLIGYLSVGPNNGLNAGDTFTIPASAQVLGGTNLLHFKVRTSGWIWGVTGLLLSDDAMPLSITTTALPEATATQGYTTTLEASGGSTPYTWSLTTG
ncbi:MAG: S8 family serine peptidase, partial [Gammaproteobacteria bacterium]|nr:S8 family serine peptidase [Gammaproteobacteria bacterium]NIR24561.1 S8 family serine peptidase [Gammaproteobacteria bacterium]NIU41905.1 S8 family serine peptidase [Gammaproteobacteria bacterium]NIW56576.1 S8 family serine peptidase [Gammaproteobacteria bacterium]NIY00780.1 S8 family serine peptidase [Gammaproteobacteria bacterium]